MTRDLFISKEAVEQFRAEAASIPPYIVRAILMDKLSRHEVYKLIDGEREYQDKQFGHTMSGDRPGNGWRSADEWALYIQGYANELTNLASHSVHDDAKLNIIRKIAGMCVCAMEQHGAPERV